MRTLLEIVQDACYGPIGLTPPTAVAASTDGIARRMLRFVNMEGTSLIEEVAWEQLTVIETFATDTVNTAQAAVPPADWQRLTPECSFWDVALRRPLIGPVSKDVWVKLVSDNLGSVDRYWTMIGGVLNIFPVSGSADTIRYPYQKKNWVVDVDDMEKERFTADTDVPLIPDKLLELGLIWRWKSSVGLDFAEDMANYTRAKEILVATHRVKGDISTTSAFRGKGIPDNYFPGVITQT
jgi:hypothetical protein